MVLAGAAAAISQTGVAAAEPRYCINRRRFNFVMQMLLRHLPTEKPVDCKIISSGRRRPAVQTSETHKSGVLR
jgi:hypothetical protein